MDYYGREPSSDFFMHYGVKGMKWGVRKAIEKGNTEKIRAHHDKALKKLYSLQEKANLLTKKGERKEGRIMAALGGGLAAAGTAANVLTAQTLKSRGHALVSPSAAIGAPILGAAGVGYGLSKAVRARRLSGAKGHAKAVKKVNDWQNSMHEAFKDTSFEKKKRKPYSDVYTVTDYSSGNPRTVASISGSKLVRNYKGNDKKKFISEAQKKSRVMAAPKTYDSSPVNGQETHVTEYLTGSYKERKKKRNKA